MEVPVRRPATDINTKQRRILEFIRDSLHNEYRCPTVREICAYVGLSSTSTVQSHLNTLEKFGYIKRDPNKNRAIMKENRRFLYLKRTMKLLALIILNSLVRD